MANLAELLVHIGVDSDELTSGMDAVSDKIDDNIGKITALGAAGGAALEGFARSQQESNVGFERMGRVTGEGADKMRDMAGDLQNVTFPMEDVTALMETATQRGLEGDAIGEYATFWDMVGDATGEAGPELGKAGTALGLVGIKAGEEAKALDAFGHITDNSTGSISDFLRFTERAGKELGDSTPHVNDMAAALTALEDKGFGAQVAQRELQQALRENDGDMDAALDTLGISGEAYDEMRGQVEGAGEAITANASAYAESFTPLQKLQSAAENLMTKYGGLADVAGSLAMPMMALGPMAKGVSLGFTAITTGIPKLVGGLGTATTAIWTKVSAMASWAATTVAQGARAVASMAVTAGQFVAHYARMAAGALAQAARMAASWVIAMGPVGWVIAAVVALVALIIANWDTVKAWTRKIWDWLGNKIEAVWTWIKDTTTGAVSAVVGFFTDLKDKAQDAVARLVVAAMLKFQELKDGAIDKAGEMLDWFKMLPSRLMSAIGDLGSLLLEKGKDIVRGLWDGIKSMGSWIAEKVLGWVADVIPGPIARALGIESPSTVAADLAREVPRGMMVGMDGEAASLARASERMALAALPELGVPSVSGSGIPTAQARFSGSAAAGGQVAIFEVDGREFARAMIKPLSDEAGRVSRHTAGVAPW